MASKKRSEELISRKLNFQKKNNKGSDGVISRKQRKKQRQKDIYKENKKFKKWSKILKKLYSDVAKDKKCKCGISAPLTKIVDGIEVPMTKIVNGVEVPINKYPWMVAILRADFYQFCGGTIISDKVNRTI